MAFTSIIKLPENKLLHTDKNAKAVADSHKIIQAAYSVAEFNIDI